MSTIGDVCYREISLHKKIPDQNLILRYGVTPLTQTLRGGTKTVGDIAGVRDKRVTYKYQLILTLLVSPTHLQTLDFVTELILRHTPPGKGITRKLVLNTTVFTIY